MRTQGLRSMAVRIGTTVDSSTLQFYTEFLHPRVGRRKFGNFDVLRTSTWQSHSSVPRRQVHLDAKCRLALSQVLIYPQRCRLKLRKPDIWVRGKKCASSVISNSSDNDWKDGCSRRGFLTRGLPTWSICPQEDFEPRY